MRHLTAVGAAAILLAAGTMAASTAGAEPEITEPVGTGTSAPSSAGTSAPSSTEPSAPSSTEPSPAPSSTEPSTAPSSTETASAPAPGGRQVTYTVTTTSDLTANIYYVIGDPPNQAAANDPAFMPLARTLVGPGAPWTFQATLNDPTQWAFVSASGGLRVNPEFRCEIAVDGQVVVSQQGGSGVQCSLRPS